jgi:hypothetical protein
VSALALDQEEFIVRLVCMTRMGMGMRRGLQLITILKHGIRAVAVVQ